MAFSKSLTDVASVAPSGIDKLVLVMSRSTGDIAAPGLDEDFRLSSSRSSSSSVVCFRFFSLLAGIGEVLSELEWEGKGCASFSLVR